MKAAECTVPFIIQETVLCVRGETKRVKTAERAGKLSVGPLGLQLQKFHLLESLGHEMQSKDKPQL